MKTAVTTVCATLSFLFLVSGLAQGGDGPYDFRDTEAYRNLSGADREALETVQRDFMLLWGALDKYADEHGSQPPENLAALVPQYLLKLPRDPFVSEEGDGQYGYRKGAPGNRAWVLSSAGLPDFPYLAARRNVGLYVCKGTWFSGVNPRLGDLFRKKDSIRVRRQKVQSMNNLRNLAILLVDRSISKGWPRYDGKSFVLSLVAHGVIDVRNPANLEVFFSPGDRERSLEAVGPDAYRKVTKQALEAGEDFHRLTSYAGRRNTERDHLLTPDVLRKVAPILADLSFPDVVLVAFSDGKVKEMTREELGIAPGAPIEVGDDAPVEFLLGLSRD